MMLCLINLLLFDRFLIPLFATYPAISGLLSHRLRQFCSYVLSIIEVLVAKERYWHHNFHKMGITIFLHIFSTNHNVLLERRKYAHFYTFAKPLIQMPEVFRVIFFEQPYLNSCISTKTYQFENKKVKSTSFTCLP